MSLLLLYRKDLITLSKCKKSLIDYYNCELSLNIIQNLKKYILYLYERISLNNLVFHKNYQANPQKQKLKEN